jgi:hypothetical protein
MQPLKQILFGFSFFVVSIANAANTKDTLRNKAYEDNSFRDKFLSISFSPMPGLFNENLVYVEYGLNSNFNIGIAAGNIHPGFWAASYLSMPSGLLPATIFTGYGGRLYGKYYLNVNNDRRSYISVQFVYKKMSYNNVTFSSQDPSQYYEEYDDYVLQNGKETVSGLDILFGWEFSCIHNRLFFDIFTGIGVRDRVYQETIVSSYRQNQNTGQILSYPPFPPSVYTYNIKYVTPVTGIKIGFNIFKK